MADAAPHDEDKAWIKRALEVLEPLRRRISVLLLPEASPGTARVSRPGGARGREMAEAAPEVALMHWALEELEPLRGRISKLREANRVTTNARVHPLLELIDMELSAFLAALSARLGSYRNRIVHEEFIDMKRVWLRAIRELARETRGLLDRYERPPLLHRAARCSHGTTTAEPEDPREIEDIAELLAFLTQHPLVYKHLLLVRGDGDDTASGSTPSRTYYDLSYLLKLLLLYMVSMFPQGYKFDKNRLIWKWASERLTGEYVWHESVRQAEEYFSVLVNKKVIIQAANYGHKPDTEAEDCRWQVNPDMLQFIASESADKGFVCIRGHNDSTEILRRLPLHQPDLELPTLLEAMDLPRTRSLAVSGAVDGISLGDFTHLRVLDLEGWANLMDEVLREQICRRMLLLRYLSVKSTGVTRLPPEIKELRHLEALDVSHTQISELPPEIKELRLLEALDFSHTQISELPPEIKELRHLETLDVSHTQISELPPEIKELRLLEALDISHTQINELPREAYKLLRLRTLDLSSTQVRQLPEQIVELRWLRSLLVGGDGINPDETVAKIPEGIVRCRDLCTLATVDLSEWSASSVEALGALWKLEVLAITWSFHQCADGRYQEALRSTIEKLPLLKSLTIHCGLGCSMEFLGSLPPPVGLEKFKVTAGRFVTVPQWIEWHCHLSFLQITVCKLGTDDLKILGELPKLQCLVLGLDFLPGEAIVIRSEEFSQLRTFSVHCLVPCMTFEGGAMPELTHLDLEIICSVPPNQEIVLSGISNLEKLREVVLRYSECYSHSSSVKKTVVAVKNEVKRGGPKLFINGTQHQAEAVDEETARKTTTEIQSEIEIEAQMP